MLKKSSSRSNGFSTVEAILLLVIVGALAGAVYLFHVRQPDAKKSDVTQAASQQSYQATVDKYAGWKTYTLTHEKITFRYPSTWQLQDESNQPDVPAESDYVKLTGSDAIEGDTFKMELYAGNFDFTLPSGGLHVKSAVSVNVAGKQGWLIAYDGNAAGTQVLDTELSQSKDKLTFFATKNVDAGAAQLRADVQFGSAMPHDLTQVQGSKDYQDAKLVIDSLRY